MYNQPFSRHKWRPSQAMCGSAEALNKLAEAVMYSGKIIVSVGRFLHNSTLLGAGGLKWVAVQGCCA